MNINFVVPSFKRPWNISAIVENALSTPEIDHVVVRHDLTGGYSVSDLELPISSRLRVVAVSGEAVGMRFQYIGESSHSINADDKVILRTDQISKLSQNFALTPKMFGIFGETRTDSTLTREKMVYTNRECLHPRYVYCHSKLHFHNYQKVAESLGIDLRTFRNGEDILISLASYPDFGFPMVCRVGSVRLCSSIYTPGIATRETLYSSTSDRSQNLFIAERVSLLRRLASMFLFDPTVPKSDGTRLPARYVKIDGRNTVFCRPETLLSTN